MRSNASAIVSVFTTFWLAFSVCGCKTQTASQNPRSSSFDHSNQKELATTERVVQPDRANSRLITEETKPSPASRNYVYAVLQAPRNSSIDHPNQRHLFTLDKII